jgi:hypothetical protein
MNERYRERRLRGLCFRCDTPRERGKSQCADCNQKHADKARERRNERIGKGLCKVCGKKRGATGTETMCRPCAQYAVRRMRNVVARRRAWGRCLHCGRDVQKFKLCVLCRAAKSRLRRKSAEATR